MAVKKVDIAREYCRKFPQTGSAPLARLMFKAKGNNLIFKDEEDARFVIRTVRNKAGEAGKRTIDKVPQLPRSYAQQPSVFKLPVADNNILVISDLHIPYQDNRAVEAALEYGLKENVNTIFINGDLLDFHQLSKFEHDPRKRHTKEEFEACQEFLEYLRYKFPKVRIYWNAGNHDKRYEHWLMSKAPELFMDEYYRMEDRLNLAKYNVKWIDDTTLVKTGKLFVNHGHLLIRGVFAPVNAARGAFMKAKASCLISHVHKVSEHQETTLEGKVIVNYSTGCLCELNPAYSPYANNYMHGFAHIRTESNGDFRVSNKKIIAGKIY